jgi:hypothetical protein
MAYIVIMGSFPAHVGMEVGKKFLEAEKLPDYVKTEHVFNAAAGDYTFFSIYKIEDESKYFDAIKAIVKRYSIYMDVVGYKYTLYPVLEAKDALSMVGLD